VSTETQERETMGSICDTKKESKRRAQSEDTLKHYRAVRDWEAKNHYNTSHNKLLRPSVHSQDKHKIKVVYEQNSRLTQ